MPGRVVLSKRAIFAAAIWAAGVFIAWYSAPAGPRPGWQPAAGVLPIGFLSDSASFVTGGGHFADYAQGTGTVSFQLGPLQVWNIDTGELVAAHETSPKYRDARILRVAGGADLLAMISLMDNRDGAPSTFEIKLIDALTGARINSFESKLQISPYRPYPASASSPDGRFIAIQDWIDGASAVVLYETATGRRVKLFVGNDTPIVFSPRGDLLAAAEKNAIVIFDLEQPRVLRELPSIIGKRHRVNYPIGFSQDGALLLDSADAVWEVATGQMRFRLADQDIHHHTNFSPDGKHVVVLTGTRTISWLSYYDIETGAEDTSRRLQLTSSAGESRWGIMRPAENGDRMFIAVQSAETSRWIQLLHLSARFLPFQASSSDWEHPCTAFVVDSGTSRVLMRGRRSLKDISPDGQHLLTFAKESSWTSGESRLECKVFDVPPGRDRRWVAAGVVLWSLVYAAALMVWRRLRGSPDRKVCDTK